MQTKLTLRRLAMVALLCLAGAATAQTLPSYYPSQGFQRTGIVDAVILQERRIIVNDIPYALSDNAVAHSLNSYSVPLSQLRVGSTIGFRTVGQKQIVELWVLPRNYNRRGRR